MKKNSQNKSRICKEFVRRFQHAQSGTILKCRVKPNAQRRERIFKDERNVISVTIYQKSRRAETRPYHRDNARSFGMSARITVSARTIRHVRCLRRFMPATSPPARSEAPPICRTPNDQSRALILVLNIFHSPFLPSKSANQFPPIKTHSQEVESRHARR